MKKIEIAGQKRNECGKKATRELRKEGLVPCNLYGEATDNGKPVALPFCASISELRNLIYTPHIYIVELIIDGEKHWAVMKEIQFHPTTDAVLHVDFYEVNEKKPIVMGVPIKHVGLAQGIRDGGRMNKTIRKINVRAPYPQIPEVLEIDVTNLHIGKSIKVGDLSYEGIELVTPKEVIVCSIKATRNSMQSSNEENATEE